MAETNLDKLSAQTGEFSSNVNGVGLNVATTDANTDSSLDISGISTGDVVLAAYTGGGGAVSPGTISSGSVASDATSGNTVTVIWADQT